jgi:hypothetical protein
MRGMDWADRDYLIETWQCIKEIQGALWAMEERQKRIEGMLERLLPPSAEQPADGDGSVRARGGA